MKNTLTLVTGLLLGNILFWGCSTSTPDEAAYQDIMDSVSVGSHSHEVPSEVISEIIQSVPSPLEISYMLKSSGVTYRSGILNSPEKAGAYNTSYDKALALGIYGTDLGYTNIYEQNQDAIKYLTAIQDLANELNIGQFFDYQTIKELASNSKNFDSLLMLTTQNFNEINDYLQDQNRSNLSVLLLAGGWLEALHIVLNTYQTNPDNQQLRETIGEQQIVLEKIVALLEFYKESDPKMAELHAELTDLKGIYDQVEINTTEGQTTTEIVDGVAMVKDETSQEVIISDQTITEISSTLGEIRTKIIS